VLKFGRIRAGLRRQVDQIPRTAEVTIVICGNVRNEVRGKFIADRFPSDVECAIGSNHGIPPRQS
jgi:hypothetical protein